MTETEFLDFARNASSRATSNVGRVGHLICTQARNTKKPTLREPEMRTAFQQEAEERRLFYGIEVPTVYSYQFTGVGTRRALVDFALLASDTAKADRDVLVEFKQGQPNGVRSAVDDTFDYPKITKDLHKLWAEPVRHGRCMFHICQAANSGTLSAVQAKYNAVTQEAITRASKTMDENPESTAADFPSDAWFLLLILVLHQRGEKTGSFLHRATWEEKQWKFLEPELLASSPVISAES